MFVPLTVCLCVDRLHLQLKRLTASLQDAEKCNAVAAGNAAGRNMDPSELAAMERLQPEDLPGPEDMDDGQDPAIAAAAAAQPPVAPTVQAPASQPPAACL